MPRIYKPSHRKQYKKYDPNLIGQALKEYNSCPKKSLSFISKKYSISKGVLQRHNTYVMKKPGGQPALSDDMEECLIQYLNICSAWGYPLEVIDVRTIIKGHLDRERIVVKRFKNNMPGQDYARSFIKRNEDKLNPRLKQNLKRSRSGVSPDIIKAYFKNLGNSLQGVPLSNIVNYDETSLSDDPDRKLVLIKRNIKYPEEIISFSRASITLMLAAAADGTPLPPYVVYKAQHVYDGWTENGPRGCRYNRTDSGWFNMATFEHWVATIVIPYFRHKTGPKVLIGDIVSTHLSIEIIRKCIEHNIFFIFLPTNSSHLTQPLEAAFYWHMKKAWKEILLNWKESDGHLQTTLPKHIFPSLFKILIDRIELNDSQNVLAGFEKCGICPINQYIVLNRLLHDTGREDIKYIEVTDKTVLLKLKDTEGKLERKIVKKSSIETTGTEDCSFNKEIDKKVLSMKSSSVGLGKRRRLNMEDSVEIDSSEEMDHRISMDFKRIATKSKRNNLNSVINRPNSSNKLKQKNAVIKRDPKEMYKESQIKKMRANKQTNIKSRKCNNLKQGVDFNQKELNNQLVSRKIKEIVHKSLACTEKIRQEMTKNTEDNDDDIIIIVVGSK